MKIARLALLQRRLRALLAGGALLLTAQFALAHHSFSMFDREKKLTISGVVKEFQWTNPHVWIQINVRDAEGNTREWSVEHGTPNMLRRMGWSKNSFKPGDSVTLVINPLKDGKSGGSFVSATFADGTTLGRP